MTSKIIIAMSCAALGLLSTWMGYCLGTAGVVYNTCCSQAVSQAFLIVINFMIIYNLYIKSFTYFFPHSQWVIYNYSFFIPK